MPEDNIPWRKWQAPVPTLVEELRNQHVRQVAAEIHHCAAVSDDGALFTWQTSLNVEEPDEPQPELGYGRFIHEFGVPHRVLALEGVRIASVALEYAFTLAVTEAGAVYSLGKGGGRLRHGEGNFREGVFAPKRIEALDGIHVARVAVGDLHALALTRCGRVYSWGALGRDSPVHGLGDGGGDGGGDGDDRDDYSPQPITALLGTCVRSIAAGSSMACAVTHVGALYTWGDNTYGDVVNLGHGDVVNRDRPTLV
jgi:alpha-tubulin suppressor-like RCC1 family protein